MPKNEDQKKRIIKLANQTIPCYFYNYFKSPGLTHYPNLSWVNEDYNQIKATTINKESIKKIATNLWKVGVENNLFTNVDYFIMMPMKQQSVSNLPLIINELVTIIKSKLNYEIKFMQQVFSVEDYLKFWENRLSLEQRQTVITNKIKLKSEYFNYFNNKKVILIDDVISTGTSIINLANELLNHNNSVNLQVLCYGSVYHWEKIYC